MNIKNLFIDGLKGKSRTFRLSPLTVVVGRNGAGKSAVGDAIRFLLRQTTAGVGADGPTLRSAMRGNRIHVSADTDDDREVARTRELRDDGTFGRSTSTVDGKDGDVSLAFGVQPPVSGEEIINFSSDRLSGFLASIGSSRSGAAIIDGLLAAMDAYGDGKLRERMEAGKPAIDAAVDVIGREHLDKRHAVKALEGSVAQSRKRLGGTSIEPGMAEAAAKKVHGLTADYDRIVREQANAASESRSSAARRDAAARELATIDVGESQPDIGAIRAELAAIRVESERLDVSEGAARKALEVARLAAAVASSTVDAAIGHLADAEGRVKELERRAGMARTVPCSGSDQWVDVDAIMADPFTEPRRLLATCPLSRDAASALQELASLDREHIESLRMNLADAERYGVEASSEEERAGEAFAAAEGAARAARNKIADLDRTLARASIQGGAERASLLRKTVAEEGARADEAKKRAESLLAEAESTKRTIDALVQSERSLRVAEERLASLQANVADLEAAEAALEEAVELKNRAAEAKHAMRRSGEDVIRSTANGILPDGISLSFDEGAVGLNDGDEFWSAAGLSTAQREMLALALNVALFEIYGTRYRLVTVEIDPLDLVSRRAVLDGLSAALDAGRISQAIVFSWLDAMTFSWLGDGWTTINLNDPF